MTEHASTHEVHQRRSTTGRQVISPAQIVAGAIGLSLIAVAFGAVVAIEPAAFDSAMGGSQDLGFLYLILGLIGLVAALAFPTRVVDRVATTEAADARVIDG